MLETKGYRKKGKGQNTGKKKRGDKNEKGKELNIDRESQQSKDQQKNIRGYFAKKD